MAVLVRVVAERGVVAVAFAGTVSLADAQGALGAAAADPAFLACRQHLVDLRAVTGYERDFPRFLALQADIAGALLPVGADVTAVFIAPTPPGQAMAELARKSWDGLNAVRIRTVPDAQAAADLMGLSVAAIEAMLGPDTADAAAMP